MGMKDILDSTKWPAPVWAVAAGLLSWWAVQGHHDPLPVVVPPIVAGVALAIATVIRAVGLRKTALSVRDTEKAAEAPSFDQRLIEEAKAHREWLHSSLQTVAWACGLVLTSGLGVALWVLGDSAHTAAANATERKLSEADWRVKLQKAIDDSLAGVPNTVKTAVEEAASKTAQNAVDDAVGKKLEQTSNASVRELVNAYLDRVAPSLTPIGSVVAWPSTEPKPDAWEVCDGHEIPAARTDRIWQVLGTTYGVAKEGKVKLPDFRACFLRGHGEILGREYWRSAEIGRAQGPSVAVADMQILIRDLSDPAMSGPPLTLCPTRIAPADSGRAAWVMGLTPTPQPDAQETRPVNYAVHWIIRVR